MHTQQGPFDIAALSVAERIELAQQLWDSVHEHLPPVTLTPAELAEVRQCSADIKAGRVTCEPFDDVMRQLRRK